MKSVHGKSVHGKHSKIVVIVSAASALLGAALPAALAGTAGADTQVGQMLAAKAPHGSCSVIAQVNGSLTPTQNAQMTALGADVTRHLGLIHSVALTLPTRNLGKLAALPFVTHLSANGVVKKYDAFTVGATGADVAYQQQGLTGRGVSVAVLDSGVRDESDLHDSVTGNSRITANQGFLPDTGDSTDLCGHGTHVAGIIAGNGASSTGSQYTQTFYGIARRANIVNVRVLDPNGGGSVDSVIAGLQWVVAHKNDNRAAPIRVINMSLGHPVSESYKTDPLCQAVEAAWRSGIVVVCAAGNYGRATTDQSSDSNEGWGTAYGSIQSPSNDPYVITVGATKSMDGVRSHDRIATYSSRGPSQIDLILKPDIIAPGNKIVSVFANDTTLAQYRWDGTGGVVLPQSTYAPDLPDGGVPSPDYFVLSGTSMAAPVVSGTAALMLEADPTLTPDTIKARLMTSADEWTDPNGNADPCTYGAGYLNIPSALASKLTVTLPARSPQLTYTSGTVSVNSSLISLTNVWGSKTLTGVNSIYGSKAMTGVNTVLNSKSLTGVNAVFSSKSLKGVRTLFGSSNVWSTKTLSGSHYSSDAVDLSNSVRYGE